MEKFSIRRTVRFCHGTGCNSSKAVEARELLEKEVAKLDLNNVTIDFTGCHGFCQQGPIAVVEPEGIFYTHVKLADIPEIARSHLRDGQPVSRLFFKDPASGSAVPHYKDIGFYNKQQRLILHNLGRINPERIEDYLAIGGYKALEKVLQMSQEQLIDEVKRSGLRGRGGAGFSTAQKWELCHKAPGTLKYMICNADEGDPGAFMDRSILEGDPHTVLEGMSIAAYAIGAAEGYVYVRAEYPLAVERIIKAIKQAEERGFLGKKILGTAFNFNVHVIEGAGAFVCGEETALMASIEGKRGMPRPRPPFPAVSGLYGKPSNINNVKTLASIPVIISRGADWYSQIGTEKARGTAVFSLVGKVANSGLVEVPMGTPLQTIIFDIGGGIPRGKRFKAVQTGGPSGGCLPASHINLPTDYESLASAGSFMGSGGMVVMDEDTCMVDIARYFLSFTQSESCGKCVPCRTGTCQMLTILTDITSGKGKLGDIDLLLRLCKSVKAASLCGLGQGAPNPVMTTIGYFREEYEEHIRRQHCRAAVCSGLVSAPCNSACPAGIDVPRYVRFINLDNPAEALAVIREKIPFPSVCGLVCFHPCEAKCRRGQLDEAIAIRELKRYAFEQGGRAWKQRSRGRPATGKRVAVIGAGPAGLTCAYYLAKLGHSVTVFEAEAEPGGMMRLTIPSYRLPKDILQAEIKEIIDLGVELRTSSPVHSVERLFKAGYQAIFMAIGAHQFIPLGIPGEDSPHYQDSLTFLKATNLGQKVKLGRRIAVIGGGSTAIDVARTAARLGGKEVTVIYRRTRAEMPASLEEVEAALEEGIKIMELTQPVRISHENRSATLECQPMKSGPVDNSGRRRPVPEGSTFSLEFDNIIAAIGQRLQVSDQFDLPLAQNHALEVDPYSLSTPVKGVFAGGDAVRGPASIIEAIADGRQAAKSIDRYLGGQGDIEETLAQAEELLALEAITEKHRVPIATLPVRERLKGFQLTELGYNREQAIEEASRCLRCDLEERK